MAKTSSTIKVKLVKGLPGTTKGVQANVRGLGLRKVGQVSELENTPSVRGMIKKIIHMLKVVE
ncbi:50S ribosomal protein L30 [Bacteriovorax stolpii]|jgi:large subunit ribosomal protein L30|uniref:50S ribosomal protein L30 n=1 Tax=Bacteriovorax stolpii TaxID=960 RepID=A0A2K9NWT7_BACTC|nr:50S ribosomal protein L30 [Bacteriovorax stolpii]AUN99972.1 50S ribosomal protein L30 [Bacteriovorax stolpii]QDK40035.1 50S ribosomal protein L30 [Bacteriovorax stolpii]TDP54135.1 LSU ribosomal protein L30P [Bacteriovorax stolpii]BDT30161.1 50S ribosomal protein L30 [Bacteriovorax sp. HI3]